MLAEADGRCVGIEIFGDICYLKTSGVANPDGVAVTWRCIDDWQDLNVTVNKFDGQNWEANAAALAHKSKD